MPARLFSFLLLFLVACGGGGSDQPPVGGGSTWDYVALGDSLAVGIGGSRGYVPRYRDHIVADTDHNVQLTNLGVPGWNSTELYNAIRTDSSFRSAISEAEVVTWDIGGNDLLSARSRYLNNTCGGGDNLECFRATVNTFRANWDGIVAEIRGLRAPGATILRTMDIYNPFVAAMKASGDFEKLKPFLDQMNAHIAQSAQNNQIPMAQVYAAFNGPNGDEDAAAKGWLSGDGVHPDDDGYARMAELLRGIGYGPLE